MDISYFYEKDKNDISDYSDSNEYLTRVTSVIEDNIKEDLEHSYVSNCYDMIDSQI
jgi:hypothetical protein